MVTAVIVEADGGSRGNPGRAAYGAVLKDAETGAVIAERCALIGIASNNVAEYSGLIAGLHLYRQHADGARLEVRMDSKLVVEQMSGRWKIKHPDMRQLAVEARRLAPSHAVYTWIPREQNTDADRLANQALDDVAAVAEEPGRPAPAHTPSAHAPAESLFDEADLFTATPELEDQVEARQESTSALGAGTGRSKPLAELGTPTTFILVRHGETDHTRDRKFSGFGGSDPGLNHDGREQVRTAAQWLAPLAGEIDVLITSPMRRTRESAALLAEALGWTAPVTDVEGIAEARFGRWDGLTFAEAKAGEPDLFDAWLASTDVAPGGEGESIEDVDARVRAAREELIERFAGQTVLAASHVTPIKLFVAQALGMPLDGIYRTELAPASVTIVSWYPDGFPVLRLFNGRPGDLLFSARSF